MFLDPTLTDILVLSLHQTHPASFAVVSSFDYNESEEANVKALRELYKHGPQDIASDLIYGDDLKIINK